MALTANGVRAGLTLLERDGLVRRAGVRRSDRPGKPADLYATTAKADETLSAAYIPAFTALATTLNGRLPRAELMAIFAAAGEGLARQMPVVTESGVPAAAAALLESLGASVELDGSTEEPVVSGHGCPLASVVRHCPEACEMVRSLLATGTGATVLTECRHGGSPSCRFAVR